MSDWNLEIRQEVGQAMEEAFEKHPHLRSLIEQRLKAILGFPPEK